eukprot:scaffold70084_cov65-Phaeocystis_antarctica.AAC.2
MVSSDQRARARPALGACATHPGHAVNMLTDERRSARHPGAASMQLHGTAHHCRLRCSARASKLSNLAPRLRPARRTVAPGDARTCMSSYGASLATFVKNGVFGENTPFIAYFPYPFFAFRFSYFAV